ncbi:hypothetical protein [Burkholderia sp. Bp9012]|uniref:hypothetical protein n=1 Tax=Burkholderia sp. Bp9012 TaxID=2184562 RepID=UPI0016231FD7|nr:hypothetical protein [Burkholderia sp. Bp9012]
MHGQSDLAVAALDEHAPTPPHNSETIANQRIQHPPDRHASHFGRTKKIARASEEARAKPSPYEDRRRGHRDPRAARVVIGYASARSAGI